MIVNDISSNEEFLEVAYNELGYFSDEIITEKSDIKYLKNIAKEIEEFETSELFSIEQKQDIMRFYNSL